MVGSRPHTDRLPPGVARDSAGFVLTGEDVLADGTAAARWPLSRAPLVMESSMPGVFAAGDVRHRSVKRIASAVGEGAIAVQMLHRYLSGETDGTPEAPSGMRP